MDLDIAGNQNARPVRVGRDLDPELIRNLGLAAVVDGEWFRARARRSDYRGYASERSVGVRPATTGADEQAAEPTLAGCARATQHCPFSDTRRRRHPGHQGR